MSLNMILIWSQVTACGDIIKQAQYNYQHTVDLLSWYSNTASWARENKRSCKAILW